MGRKYGLFFSMCNNFMSLSFHILTNVVKALFTWEGDIYTFLSFAEIRTSIFISDSQYIWILFIDLFLQNHVLCFVHLESDQLLLQNSDLFCLLTLVSCSLRFKCPRKHIENLPLKTIKRTFKGLKNNYK